MKLLLLTDQQFHHIKAGLSALASAFLSGSEALADYATDQNNHARMMPEQLAALGKTLGDTDPDLSTVLAWFGERQSPDLQPYVDAFQGDDEHELEGAGLVSPGSDPGAWVMTWAWITDDAAGIDPDNFAPGDHVLVDFENASWPGRGPRGRS
jgi:hypothetical protein